MIKPLLPIAPNNPILRQSCEPIDPMELKSKDFQKLIDAMLDFVYGHNNKPKVFGSANKSSRRSRAQAMTVGLSANQVGINQQISVVDLGISHRNYNDIHVLINPQIIFKSKSQLKKTEGCVNLPTVWGQINRSKIVKVKALDRSGNEITIKATGWPAILLQHEIDHLHGRLFIDHLDDPTSAQHVLDTDYAAYKKSHKNWTKFIDISHLTKPLKS